jgi:hypothetical protein
VERIPISPGVVSRHEARMSRLDTLPPCIPDRCRRGRARKRRAWRHRCVHRIARGYTAVVAYATEFRRALERPIGQCRTCTRNRRAAMVVRSGRKRVGGRAAAFVRNLNVDVVACIPSAQQIGVTPPLAVEPDAGCSTAIDACGACDRHTKPHPVRDGDAPRATHSLQRAPERRGGVVQAWRSGCGCTPKRATTAWRAVCQGRAQRRRATIINRGACGGHRHAQSGVGGCRLPSVARRPRFADVARKGCVERPCERGVRCERSSPSTGDGTGDGYKRTGLICGRWARRS